MDVICSSFVVRHISVFFLISIFLQISKEHGGIMRFIQVSCLGASSSSPSRFLRTKAAAEEAVLSELPEVELFPLLLVCWHAYLRSSV